MFLPQLTAPDDGQPLCQREGYTRAFHGLSHAGLAAIFDEQIGWAVDAVQDRIETRQFAERAIQLDKDNPLVLAFSGQAYSLVLEEPENGMHPHAAKRIVSVLRRVRIGIAPAN